METEPKEHEKKERNFLDDDLDDMSTTLQENAIPPEQAQKILDAIVMLIEEGYLFLTSEMYATAYEVAIDIESKKVDPGIGIDKILYVVECPRHTRPYHINRFEASRIKQYREISKMSYREIAYITERSLESIHRVIQEAETKQTTKTSVPESYNICTN